jgi:hypothetical protein
LLVLEVHPWNNAFFSLLGSDLPHAVLTLPYDCYKVSSLEDHPAWLVWLPSVIDNKPLKEKDK